MWYSQQQIIHIYQQGYLQYPQLPSKNAIYLHAVKDDDIKPKTPRKR